MVNSISFSPRFTPSSRPSRQISLPLSNTVYQYALRPTAVDSVHFGADNPDNREHTALTLAAKSGQLRRLQEHTPDELNRRDDKGWTPLTIAAATGQCLALNFLCNRGVDVDLPESHGHTPLMVAVFKEKPEAVKALIEHSANLQIKDKNGHTALQIARKLLAQSPQNRDRLKIVEHLENAGSTNTPVGISSHTAALMHLEHPGRPKSGQRHSPLKNVMSQAEGSNAKLLSTNQPLQTVNEESSSTHPLITRPTAISLPSPHSAIPYATKKEGIIQLGIAAAKGHFETVKVMLSQDPSLINQPDSQGNTPLLLAAANNKIGTLRLLLEKSRGANIFHLNHQGFTALSAAALKGQTEAVSVLLASGANINQTNSQDDTTALYAAASRGHCETVDVLIHAGADITKASKTTGMTPLAIATKGNHLATVRTLLDKNISQVNQPDHEGMTPLMYAALNDSPDLVKLLMNKGAKINQVMGPNGVSALTIAAQTGKTETVKLLLERGANIDQASPDGSTPLFLASKAGHFQTVQALLAKLKQQQDMSQFKKAGHFGLTPLTAAAHWGHVKVVDLLLEAGADVNQADRDGKGETPLSAAVRGNNLNVVRLLVSRGANILQPNIHNKTVLDYAAMAPDIRELLNGALPRSPQDEKPKNKLVKLFNKVIAGVKES